MCIWDGPARCRPSFKSSGLHRVGSTRPPMVLIHVPSTPSTAAIYHHLPNNTTWPQLTIRRARPIVQWWACTIHSIYTSTQLMSFYLKNLCRRNSHRQESFIKQFWQIVLNHRFFFQLHSSTIARLLLVQCRLLPCAVATRKGTRRQNSHIATKRNSTWQCTCRGAKKMFLKLLRMPESLMVG